MKYTSTFIVTLGTDISFHLHSNILHTEYVRHLLLQQLLQSLLLMHCPLQLILIFTSPALRQ
jgi:hypothetical protein